MKFQKICCLFLILCIFMSILSGCNASNKLDIEYSEKGIVDFLSRVCKNTKKCNAEIYKIESPYSKPTSNNSYRTKLKVTLPNQSENLVELYFSSHVGSDQVSSIAINIYSDASEERITCYLAVIKAIEKTVCGKSYINEYFSDAEDVISFGENSNGIEGTTEQYSLSDETNVTLQGSHPPYWTVTYFIYNE